MDAGFQFDQAEVEKLRSLKPWMKDPKYFTTVRLSACASIKMMTHSVSGVEKGMSSGGKPVEVMGLMVGHPCPNSLGTLVVSDVFPLPVEGAETRVLADDQEVLNYMIDLGESIEVSRPQGEHFIGWYHSHPFDVEIHTHCFMSSTDITTQLGWQRVEDRNGNPWLGIVIDPLRSLAKGRPEIGAFRAYPPEFTAPPNETPDGRIEHDDKTRVERWGSCWNRYHALKVTYFMSSLSANVLNLVSKNYLWMSAISSTPSFEKENRDRFAERVNAIKSKLVENGIKIGGTASTKNSAADKSTQSSVALSVEHLQYQLAQVSKYILLCKQ